MVAKVTCMSSNWESRIVNTVNNMIPVPLFHLSKSEITYCNQSFLALFEITTLDQLRLAPADLFVNESTLNMLLQQCDDKPQINVMVQCKTRTRTFWGLLSLAKALDAEGVYYSGIIQDQTEIIDREKLLRERNEDLKKLNSQLDRFIYSASHDIRQPVASIMGLIHLMQLEGHKACTSDYLVKIQSSIARLDQFLTKIMQFSQNSHEHIESNVIDLREMFTEKLLLFESAAIEKRIVVSMEISDTNVFYSDRERLAVAVQHLIKNCFDFYDQAKSDPYIKILATTYPEKTIIEIIDNGIGISKNHVDKVTSMFYRASDRSKGSGLGLYIVNEILLKLKGTLLIDSELGLGTMVRMEIPNGIKGQLVNRKRALVSQQSPQ